MEYERSADSWGQGSTPTTTLLLPAQSLPPISVTIYYARMKSVFGLAGAIVGVATAAPSLVPVVAAAAAAFLAVAQLKALSRALPRQSGKPYRGAAAPQQHQADPEQEAEPEEHAAAAAAAEPKSMRSFLPANWAAKFKTAASLSRQSSELEQGDLIKAVPSQKRGVVRLARQGSAALKRVFATSSKAEAEAVAA